MSLTNRVFKSAAHPRGPLVAALIISGLAVSGCTAGTGLNPSETLYQGYVVDNETLALVPVGSSREQVLLSLGTPSTTATFDNEVLYYISQKRHRSMAFMKPKLVDQTILAIYLDKEGTVSQIANYTLKDGKVFDMISRTTPTGGKEISFLGQILTGNGVGKSMARSVFGGSSGPNN